MVVKKKELLKYPKADRQFAKYLRLNVSHWTKEKLQRLQRNLVVHSK
jgi:hypothetical protein